MNRLRTNWIWLPNWIPEDDSDACIVYFRKEMMVDDALPCIAIMIVVLAFNFLGDGLRDVLDPYMKNQ